MECAHEQAEHAHIHAGKPPAQRQVWMQARGRGMVRSVIFSSSHSFASRDFDKENIPPPEEEIILSDEVEERKEFNLGNGDIGVEEGGSGEVEEGGSGEVEEGGSGEVEVGGSGEVEVGGSGEVEEGDGEGVKMEESRAVGAGVGVGKQVYTDCVEGKDEEEDQAKANGGENDLPVGSARVEVSGRQAMNEDTVMRSREKEDTGPRYTNTEICSCNGASLAYILSPPPPIAG